MKKPILSISLLSSGRKKTIRKCLDSLKPIMEQVPCELIIVDTGCDEETHALLLEYTDQVIPFTWCNDFSKARNAGLEKASGEWFMFIDDDEWFIDVQEIVTFFVSGEYHKYACANYIQRNYVDYQETRYKDSWVSRLIRLDEDTRFESSIHEYLYPVKGVCKLLHSPVKHFGYIFETEQQKYEHSKRNISLLVDMIGKERDNLRWWTQLAQEYRGIREFTKLQELCLEALDMIQNITDDTISRSCGTFYVGVLVAEMSRYNHKDAEVFFEKAIQDKRNTPICMGRLYSLGAELFYKEEKYEKCEYYCREYFKIYEKYHENEIAMLEQGGFFVQEVFDVEVRNNVYCFYIGSMLKRGEASGLKEYFWKLGWEEENISLYLSVISDIFRAFAKMEYESWFADIAQTMMNRKGVNQKVIMELMQIEKTDTVGFINLCRIFADIEASHYYIWYMKIRNADYTGKTEQLSMYYEELFGRVENLFQLNDSVFDIAEKHQLNLEPFFLKVPFDQWKSGVDVFCRQASSERIQRRKELVEDMNRTENSRYDYFFMKLAEQAVVAFDGNDNFKELQNTLQNFVEKTLEFYKRFFKKEAFSGEMEILPAACRVAVKLSQVFSALKEGKIKEVREGLQGCIGIYRPMDKTIKMYAKLYAEEQKKLLEEEKNTAKELQALAIQVKDKIKFLLEQQEYQDALSACLQLKYLLPNDKEVLALEQQIKEYV